MFSTQIIVSLFVQSFDTTSLFAAELEEPIICISGNGLRKSETEVLGNAGLISTFQLRSLLFPDRLCYK